jgi:hypothetical protein
MTKRPRPNIDQVRDAMRGRDERIDDAEALDEAAAGAGEAGGDEGEDDDEPPAARRSDGPDGT